MDQRPPGSAEPAPEPLEPPERSDPPAPPHSTIITADPVLTDDGPRPEVHWAAPQAAGQREVPGAPGIVFASTVARFAAYWLDGLLLILASAVLGALAASVLSIDSRRDGAALGAVFYLIYTALTLVYFVGFWTGARRATLGMRAFGLQVGNAFDGRQLSIEQALKRWVLLGYPLGLVALIPQVAVVAGLLSLILPIVLLVTTVASPTKQGLHDRFAGSAVVQPAGRVSSGAATACLVVVIAVVVVSLLSIAALIFLGGQIEQILSEVGESV
jgi:uncharacterized RDD family membrane protein YckC